MKIRRDPQPYLPLTPALFHVLVALADGEKHGYAILKTVREATSGRVRLSTGTLYGILNRLLADEMIEDAPPRAGESDPRRGATYRLTAFGRDVARAETARLESVVRLARAANLTPRRVS